MNLRISCVLAVVLALHHVSQAGTAEADKRLRKAVDDVISIAEASSSNAELIKRISPVVEKNMSFPAMTRRAIGPGWRQFSSAQQKEAIDLFTQLIIRRYAGRFTIGEHPSVTYKSATEPAPGRVEVPTLLLYKGSRYEVLYRLEKAEGWKITDVVVEGVSFIANYRTQFAGPFQQGGAAAVLNALKRAVENPK